MMSSFRTGYRVRFAAFLKASTSSFVTQFLIFSGIFFKHYTLHSLAGQGTSNKTLADTDNKNGNWIHYMYFV